MNATRAPTLLSPTRTSSTISKRKQRTMKILVIARRFFLESGFSATTMSAIAAEIGGSKSTLWSYFPTKEALFAEVIAQAIEEYHQEITVLMAPSNNMPESIRKFCFSFISRLTSPDVIRLHRLVIAEADRFPALGKIYCEKVRHPTCEVIALFMARQQKVGKLVPKDPYRLAEALMSWCLGSLYQRALTGFAPPGGDAIAAEALAVADLFLCAFGGVRPPNEASGCREFQ